MGSKRNHSNVLIIVLTIIFAIIGIYFFVQAIRMSSSFSFLTGGPKSVSQNATSGGQTKGSSQNTNSSDVSSLFQQNDPFQKRCNDNQGKGGTSVSSNTVCP